MRPDALKPVFSGIHASFCMLILTPAGGERYSQSHLVRVTTCQPVVCKNVSDHRQGDLSCLNCSVLPLHNLGIFYKICSFLTRPITKQLAEHIVSVNKRESSLYVDRDQPVIFSDPCFSSPTGMENSKPESRFNRRIWIWCRKIATPFTTSPLQILSSPY